MFVDSNIFIFANDGSYPEHADAVRLLENAGEELRFNTIIALETHYGYLRNLGPQEAEKRLRSMFESRLLGYCEVTKDDVLEGARISRDHGIKTNDATIIANMLRNGTKTIATNNVKDFEKHPGIRVVAPIGRGSS